jgi:hypothetical protein
VHLVGPTLQCVTLCAPRTLPPIFALYFYGKISFELCEVFRRAIIAQNSTALCYHISLANTNSLVLVLDINISNSAHISRGFVSARRKIFRQQKDRNFLLYYSVVLKKTCTVYAVELIWRYKINKYHTRNKRYIIGTQFNISVNYMEISFDY